MSLIVAIDVSDNVIAVVGAEEHVLKSGPLAGPGWVKHFREVPSRRKCAYLRALPRRYSKILNYLRVSRITRDITDVDRLLHSLRPKLAIIDDRIFNEVRYEHKVKESTVKASHLKKLILLADNLANYFRIILKERPKEFNDELRRFTR